MDLLADIPELLGQMAFVRVLHRLHGGEMCAQAVTKAGSFDVEKIIKAFEGLSMEGTAGPLTIRPEDHQIQTPVVIGEYADKTKYYPHPYLKPATVVSAEDSSLTLEESGWKPYKGN